MNPATQIPRLWISTGTIVALLVLWFSVTNTGLISPTYLPSPQDLFKSFTQLVTNGYQQAPLWEHIGYSLFRALTGFALGVAVGIPTGLVTGYMRTADAAMSPIMAFIRPIPPIAFIPMVVLYFGLGEVGKVVLISTRTPVRLMCRLHTSAPHKRSASLGCRPF